MPQSAEAMLKRARASRKIRFVPQRSPNQPETGMTVAMLMRYTTTTGSTEVAGTANCLASAGSATVTMVLSRIAMNMAETKTIQTLTLGSMRKDIEYGSEVTKKKKEKYADILLD